MKNYKILGFEKEEIRILERGDNKEDCNISFEECSCNLEVFHKKIMENIQKRDGKISNVNVANFYVRHEGTTYKISQRSASGERKLGIKPVNGIPSTAFKIGGEILLDGNKISFKNVNPKEIARIPSYKSCEII